MISQKKSIIEYTRNHPGTIKQHVVDNNKSSYSRNPILRTINELHEAGIIVVKKDEHNSPVHSLFINNENMLMALTAEIAIIF